MSLLILFNKNRSTPKGFDLFGVIWSEDQLLVWQQGSHSEMLDEEKHIWRWQIQWSWFSIPAKIWKKKLWYTRTNIAHQYKKLWIALNLLLLKCARLQHVWSIVYGWPVCVRVCACSPAVWGRHHGLRAVAPAGQSELHRRPEWVPPSFSWWWSTTFTSCDVTLFFFARLFKLSLQLLSVLGSWDRINYISAVRAGGSVSAEAMAGFNPTSGAFYTCLPLYLPLSTVTLLKGQIRPYNCETEGKQAGVVENFTCY